MTKRSLSLLVLAAGLLASAAGIALYSAVNFGLAAIAPQPRFATVSEEEAEVFGRRFEEAFAEGPDAAAALFDGEGLADRVFPSSSPWLTRLTFFISGGGEEVARSFVGGLSQGVGPRGAHQYRGAVEREGETHARFRILYVDGGAAFHDYRLGRRDDGEVRIVDVHTMELAGYLSDAQRTMAAWSDACHPVGIQRLGGYSRDDALMGCVQELIDDELAEEALDVHGTLSEAARGDRLVARQAVHAAVMLDDADRYLAVLEEVAQRFPDDPLVHKFIYEERLTRGEWSAALDSLDVIVAQYPDPYWTAMRALVLLDGGDRDARATAERAEEADPSFYDGHVVLLQIALANGDLAAADDGLRALVSDFDTDPEGLATVSGFERLVDLPSYPGAAN